jgi:hypothetical protein
MKTFAVLGLAVAVTLTGVAAQPASAAKKPRKLWYRLSVEAEGRHRTLDKPGPDRRGTTLDQDMTWTAASRTAFVLYRSTLVAPRGRKVIAGYNFSAGVAGRLLSSTSVETDYAPNCTPSSRAFRQTAPVPVQGVLSAYLPDDRAETGFDPDQVLTGPGVPAASGLVSASGYRCTALGQVYSEVLPPPDAPAAASIPLFCRHVDGAVNSRLVVKGKVSYGRAFTLGVRCEARWDNAGAIASRRTIEYRLKFTPCPKGGRLVKRC